MNDLHPTPMTIQLCPAQQRAYDGLLHALPVGNVFVLSGDTGSGKTTVLREVHGATGGAFLTLSDFVNAMRSRHPLALYGPTGHGSRAQRSWRAHVSRVKRSSASSPSRPQRARVS